MNKPNCYDCQHRRDLAGDCHSECCHPKRMEAIMASVKRRTNDTGLNVTGDAHGIKHGWFFWPFNFDPVWLKSCTGFEERKVNQDETTVAK